MWKKNQGGLQAGNPKRVGLEKTDEAKLSFHGTGECYQGLTRWEEQQVGLLCYFSGLQERNGQPLKGGER